MTLTMSSNFGMVCKPAPRTALNDQVLTELLIQELDDIVSKQCQTHGLIDDALRSYFTFTTNYKGLVPTNTDQELPYGLEILQGNTFTPNMTSHAAPSSFSSRSSSLHTRTMSAGRLSSVSWR